MKRLDELSGMDLTDEDGYREWTKRAMELTKGLHGEIAFSSQVLYQVLSVTPVSNPRNGRFAFGDDSKHYARKVRGFLRRAAQSQEFAAGQIAGAWSQFENGFLAPSHTPRAGMNIHSRKPSRGRKGA
jgi:hypothetical protein